MEIQTSGGEIVGILMKLKDDMFADLADSQKADEEASKANHAALTNRSDEARNPDEPPAG